jgi:hypothetical protein
MMSTLQGCNVSRADIAAVLAGRERLDFQDFLQFLASNTGSIQVGAVLGGVGRQLGLLWGVIIAKLVTMGPITASAACISTLT